MNRTVNQSETDRPKKEIKRQLTPRDLYLLTWVAEQYAVRFDHVRLLLARQAGAGSKAQSQDDRLSEGNTYRIIQKLKEMGFIESRKIVGDEPFYIWATSKGIKAVGVDYRERIPSLGAIKHYHFVNCVRLYTEKRSPNIMWKSERAIRGETESMDAKEREGNHVPDGLLIYNGKETPIEVELTRKAKDRQVAIMGKLAKDFERTYFFVSESTKEQTEEIAGKYPNRFVIREMHAIQQELGLSD